MVNSDKHILFFGFGYVAQALYPHLKKEEGWTFSATARRAQKAKWLKARGIEPYDLYHAPVQEATHILVSVPPEQGVGDPVLKHHTEALATAPNLKWVGYLSSTGVYGDHGGGWVDELTKPEPTNARSRRRYQAESAWHALHKNREMPLHIFRLGAIYGPGRNMLERITKGDHVPIVSDVRPYSNRIHVDDIVQALRASLHDPIDPLGQVYNLVDDNPTPTPEIVEYAYDLLGIERPEAFTLAKSGLSAMAKSFYRDNRRVKGRMIKDRYQLTWKYPDFKDGFADLIKRIKAEKKDVA